MRDDDMRDALYRAVYENFVGPLDESFSGLEYSNPKSRNSGYAAGILFPAGTEVQEMPAEEVSQSHADGRDDERDSADAHSQSIATTGSRIGVIESADEPISLSNASAQSAISITIRLPRGASIQMEVQAATYSTEKLDEHAAYRRHPISWSKKTAIPAEPGRPQCFEVGETKLEVMIVYRYPVDQDSDVLTIALRNTNHSEDPRSSDLSKCYFQCKFAVECIDGFLPIEPYGSKPPITRTLDELSTALIYSDVHNYALGHGCAADWDDRDSRPTRIETSVLPIAEIHPTSAKVREIEGCSFAIDDFAEPANWDSVKQSLNKLCNAYRAWIDSAAQKAMRYSDWKAKAAENNLASCRRCLMRMEEGLTILDENAIARKAFHLTNQAMFDQYLHYSVASGEKTSLEDARADGRSWRPFQIAFLLLNVKSMVDPLSDDHKILDLIWFPTGGGKTEAYLGLSAFTLILERLNGERGEGTSIIMRYTLRLLSSQQFSRAAALICALEVIRRENPEELGATPFSIGLWVGALTPNHWQEAIRVYEKRRGGVQPNADKDLIVSKCPWCGKPLLLTRGAGATESDIQGRQCAPGYKKITKGEPRLKMICPNSQCDFSDEAHPLPLEIVDDEIYENPPSLLLGTVDKFATIPYQEKSYAIFGINETGEQVHYPKLIIQDELHLISGPLGSMVGCYETLIDELCSEKRPDGKKLAPKIIASTATVSKAKEQCNQLFDCGEDNVSQFPPSGISHDDSFFARIDANQSGRRYVGIYAPNITGATASIRLYTELLWEPCAWKVDSEEERDPYWTVVGYYNTTRELGQALTWTSSDIPERLREKRSRHKEIERPRYLDNVLELTGRKDSSEVTEGLESLANRYPGAHDKRAIDICLATNMISVGLDVPRLGTMVVAGQPKETSEYIQASSRVGRGSNKGMVFTLYSPTKPRDRSHYESFKTYHASFYQHVEPSSVTAFCKQVRNRSLAGILVGLYRATQPNRKSPNNPNRDVLERLADSIVARIEDIDPGEAEQARAELQHIIKQWKSEEYETWKDYCLNGYSDELPLIHSTGAQANPEWNNKSFEAPTSLRTVDEECGVAICSWM